VFNNLTYQHVDFGDDGLYYERHGRFANPNPNRRDGFSNPNREARVLFPNHGREGGYPNPYEYKMKVDIPSISGNLDIASFLIGSMRWINSLTWLMIFYGEASQICGVQAQRRSSCMVGSTASLTKASRKATYDDREAHKTTLIR